jgi:hypothetical protein
MTEPKMPELPAPENEADTDGCTYACPEGFTASQMLAIRDAGIKYGLELAAQICDDTRELDMCDSIAVCVDRIRAKAGE